MSTNLGILVDPVTPKNGFQIAKDNQITLKQVLVTHHHSDHQNIPELRRFSTIPVISGDDRVPEAEIVENNQEWTIGEMTIKSIFTPGHTTGHMSYYITDSTHSEHHIFTGDFLFIGGCGRLFEGDATMMWTSMKRLKQLPKESKIWVGHEYTLSNYKWAISIDPSNSHLQDRLKWAQNTECTIPSTLEEELKSNLFLQSDTKRMMELTNSDTAVKCLHYLRDSKDTF